MEMPGQSKDFEFAKYRESKQLSKGDQEMDNSEYLPPAFFFFYISSPPTHTSTNKSASFELKEEFISEYRSELKSFCNGPTENNAIS